MIVFNVIGDLMVLTSIDGIGIDGTGVLVVLVLIVLVLLGIERYWSWRHWFCDSIGTGIGVLRKTEVHCLLYKDIWR